MNGKEKPKRRHGHKVATGVFNFLFPPVCANCHRMVAAHDLLCAQCWSGVDWIEAPICPHLGLPFEHEIGSGILSAAAIANPQPFRRARSAVIYSDIARLLVHALKYRDRHDVIGAVARPMVRAGAELIGDADMLVPVPLHPWRQWQRRYNQSALLAHTIGHFTDLAAECALLKRIRSTRQQVGLTQNQRQRNVGGAFRVADRARAVLAGRSVVLIDDVMTSGATAAAATRALLRGGARQVDVLTFARVVAGRDIGY